MTRQERISEIVAQIQELQAELITLVEVDPVPAPPTGDRASLPTRIVEALNSRPNHLFTTPEIAAALGLPREQFPLVRAALFRLKNTGRIQRARIGTKDKYRARVRPRLQGDERQQEEPESKKAATPSYEVAADFKDGPVAQHG